MRRNEEYEKNKANVPTNYSADYPLVLNMYLNHKLHIDALLLKFAIFFIHYFCNAHSGRLID